MSISVELTYDMGKDLGEYCFSIDAADSVADVLRITRERFGDKADRFDLLTRVAAVSVNGVLVNHRRGAQTKLADGDRVAFLKAAAGG